MVAAGDPGEWGRRLSDRVRAALGAGECETARRLVLEGDGDARSLAKEYALMYRGLGITLRALLELLGARLEAPPRAVSGCPASGEAAIEATGDTATGAAGALLSRFRGELIGIMAEAYGEEAVASVRGTGGLEPAAGTGAALRGELEATAALLGVAEARFGREQSRLAEEVLRAIEAGDLAGARALVDRKEQGQYVPLHDRMVRFMAEVFALVLERFGADGLQRFHRETAEAQRRGFEAWERLPVADFARVTAFLLKQHMGTVSVREGPDRFTIDQTPCGSGGRLRLAGAYAGPGALPMVPGPGPLTAGEPELAVYCTHCPIWNGLAPVEWFGRPQWVLETPSRPDGSCTLHLEKRRDGAPAAYRQRLGLTASGR